jgi:hypothetical protein
MATYNIYELPFDARQQIVTISLIGMQYRMRLAWNIPANCWVLDIRNADDTPFLSGVPIVTGADLLAQFGYLGIRGQMLALTDYTRGDLPPNFDNLGTTGHVYFLPDNSQPI